MIEEFKDNKGAYIKSDSGEALEFRDYEIRDLHNDLSELIVKWDKNNHTGNKELVSFSDFKNNVIIRIGDSEFSMTTNAAIKLYFQLGKAIEESV